MDNKPFPKRLTDEQLINMVTELEESEQERELPEDQVKGETDKNEDAQITPHEKAEDLSDYLNTVQSKTVEQGIVKGSIKEIHHIDDNDKILVKIELPGETELETFNFKKPKSYDRTYDIVRWLGKYNYTVDHIPKLVQKEVEVEVQKIDTDNRRDNETYELVIPEYEEETGLRGKLQWLLDKVEGVQKGYEEEAILAAGILSFLTTYAFLWVTITGQILYIALFISAVNGLIQSVVTSAFIN